jgi:hypothetical protein
MPPLVNRSCLIVTQTEGYTEWARGLTSPMPEEGAEDDEDDW